MSLLVTDPIKQSYNNLIYKIGFCFVLYLLLSLVTNGILLCSELFCVFPI
jgi:hypothetical protein